MARQRRFHFAQLDPAAANFYLVVGAAQELEVAIGAIARQVSAAEQIGTRILVEWVCDKSCRGQLAAMEIATREIVAADVDFAAHPDGNRLKIAIKQIELGVLNRPADGNRSVIRDGFELIASHIGRYFRRAVQIDQPAFRQLLAKARGQ